MPPQKRSAIRVQIGCDPDLADTLVEIVNSAYGKQRVSDQDMRKRVVARTNRVLHVAFDQTGAIVGCCSSTLYVPWCGPGTGHWGLLAVSPAHQGRGVASALVAAAEKRLVVEGMSSAGMEYSFREGDELAERLYAWYEGADGLRYVCSKPKQTGFRMCRKALTRANLDDGDKTVVPSRSTVGLFCAWFFSVLRMMCWGY